MFALFSNVFWKTSTVVSIALALIIAALTPWVLVLHLGILVYWPYEPNGQGRYLRVAGPLTHSVYKEWVPKEDIPKTCLAAVVAAEDTKFFEHRGIDIDSMIANWERNQKRGRVKAGGSTITQQLVKNAFLSRSQNYLRKGRELVGAVLLDATMTKESQLVWYWNIVEFGPRIYGIEKAASTYFNKPAKDLNPAECISLAAVLPSPNKWNRGLQKKEFTPFLRKRYQVILGRMDIMDLVPAKVLRSAKQNDPFGRPVRYEKPTGVDPSLIELPDEPPSMSMAPTEAPTNNPEQDESLAPPSERSPDVSDSELLENNPDLEPLKKNDDAEDAAPSRSDSENRFDK